MRRGWHLLASAVTVATLAACATDRADRTYLGPFIAAERAATPFDPITASQPTTDFAGAYRMQQRYVRHRLRTGDTVAGYKGGLMSHASLKARNVAEPLVGVVFASGRADDGATISLCGYRKASFELKLGYLLPSSSADPSRGVMVLPVIDLPDIAYRDPDHYGAIDMVAANVSAARYVRGAMRDADGVDLDGVRVSLTRDGQPMASGLSAESLGGQRRSLDTVLTLARRTGRDARPGDLIVTGKIGDRGWLLPGRYSANYGPLGMVRFTVVACAVRPAVAS
jgi:2-keto-4-pentenoate hydratase